MVLASDRRRAQAQTGGGGSPGGARILLAAGGTGGHIYPAVALAEALAELSPGVRVQFCCGSRPAELQIYRRLGLRPWVLPVAHNRPGPIERGKFIGRMLVAWARARGLLRAQPVQVAVGFGSYVSVPPLLAARLAGARLALHEPDARMGMANRLLAPLARRITSAVPLRGRPLLAPRIAVVGNPVRKEFTREQDRAAARAFFRLNPDRLVCLCVGGSQGAAGINQLMLELVQWLHETEGPVARWQVLWSTGPAHFDRIAKAAASIGLAPEEHVINPYIDRMALAYAAADLVVARAGALSIAELAAAGKPAVLVPLPSSAGGHQIANARRLAQSGAAELILESDPRAAERLRELLARWAEPGGELAKMAAASRALGRPNAAVELARIVLELVRREA